MKTAKELIQLVQLERLDTNLFRGNSYDVGSGHVYGGQGLAQALDAAYQTVEEGRVVHSMHGYFILPGSLNQPIIYNVEQIRNGGSFTTRRVSGIQNGKVIFIMAVSFQIIQEGYDHQVEMPDVPQPDDLQSEEALFEAFGEFIPKEMRRFMVDKPIAMKPVDPMSYFKPEKQKPLRYVWFKSKGEVPQDLATNQKILAYASDFNLISTALLPHQHDPNVFKVQMASLDHAMWFHRKVDTSDWLLYALDSPSASNARGFNRGTIFNQKGQLVASVVQEGLMRPRKPKK